MWVKSTHRGASGRRPLVTWKQPQNSSKFSAPVAHFVTPGGRGSGDRSFRLLRGPSSSSGTDMALLCGGRVSRRHRFRVRPQRRSLGATIKLPVSLYRERDATRQGSARFTSKAKGRTDANPLATSKPMIICGVQGRVGEEACCHRAMGSVRCACLTPTSAFLCALGAVKSIRCACYANAKSSRDSVVIEGRRPRAGHDQATAFGGRVSSR